MIEPISILVVRPRATSLRLMCSHGRFLSVLSGLIFAALSAWAVIADKSLFVSALLLICAVSIPFLLLLLTEICELLYDALVPK